MEDTIIGQILALFIIILGILWIIGGGSLSSKFAKWIVGGIIKMIRNSIKFIWKSFWGLFKTKKKSKTKK